MNSQSWVRKIGLEAKAPKKKAILMWVKKTSVRSVKISRRAPRTPSRSIRMSASGWTRKSNSTWAKKKQIRKATNSAMKLYSMRCLSSIR